MKLTHLSRLPKLLASPDELRLYEANQFGITDAVEGLRASLSGEKDKAMEYSAKAGRGAELGRIFQQRVLEKLRSGDWSALGYVLPRLPLDDRASIPIDVWHNFPQINWERGTVKGQGLSFVGVAAVDSQAQMRSPPNRNSSLGQPYELTKKVGRPTVRPLIIEAYKALKLAGIE